jgi:predicted RNA-binding Zn-ribbon protein involved in translation (DUF1610 family)
MPADWVRRPGPREDRLFLRRFEFTDRSGRFRVLSVDPDTHEVVPEQQPILQSALADVRAGRLQDLGVLDTGRTEHDPGAIRCACGEVVDLTTDWEGTACPNCGNEYGSGGELCRANWREVCRETGELED